MINYMKQLTVKDLRNELKVAFKENNKSLMKEVKSDIKSAIKENTEVLIKEVRKEIRGTVKASELSLKKYVGEYVGDATEKVTGAMQEMFDERDVKINQLTVSVDNVKRDVKFMHQDIKDIVTDMSDKPSRKQFETFKSSFSNYPTV